MYLVIKYETHQVTQPPRDFLWLRRSMVDHWLSEVEGGNLQGCESVALSIEMKDESKSLFSVDTTRGPSNSFG